MKFPRKKGQKWERDAVEELNKQFPDTWKKIPMSGAAGTILNVPELKPDLVGKYVHMDRRLAGEAKTGYGGSEQMAIQRKWFEKIAKQAIELYAIPILMFKFSGSRGEVRYVVAMSFQAWDELMLEYQKLYEENVALWAKLESLSPQNGND